MSLSPGTRLGPYEVLALIGVGGMGEVYRAHDRKLRRDVALKILPVAFALDPDRVARFNREAQVLASLNHPHIAAIYGFEETDDMHALALELVEGLTLADRIAQGPLPIEESLKIASEIADGLEVAHEKGIIHRDLKPANIKVTVDDHVKVLDFGLAKILLDDRTADPSTSPTMTAMASRLGTIVGTAAYMSPEQAKGKPVDKRADIWAFGCVLFELLTGQRAFTGEDIADLLVAVLTKEPDWTLLPAATPPRIVELVRRCLRKDPRERLRDIGDARIEILSNADGDPASAMPTRRRLGRVLGTIAALLVAGVGVGIVTYRALGRAAAEPPTPRRLTFERGEVRAARFAPDGNTVVYSAQWRGEPSELFTTRVDSRESRPLGVPGRLYAVSSMSELAVDLAYRSGNIARVPLAGGAPRTVMDHVGWADWSADGADLAVVRALQGKRRIEFPIGNVIYETDHGIGPLRVSPGGDWLAFGHHLADSEGGSLEVVGRTGEKRVLSSNWADLGGVAWRPDGREIWFTAARRGEFKSLRAVTLDGAERLVARLLGQVTLQDVGRDGRVLITLENYGIEMRALGPSSAKERDVTWLGLSEVADLSSDGRRVLFTQHPEGAGEGGQTYIRQTDGTPGVRLGDGLALALSPDGKWALSQLTSPERLVLLPTGAGTPKTLKGAALTYLERGSWFPDSRRVVFMAQANNSPPRAYVQDTEDGDPLPIGPPGVFFPIVAPDGRTVAAFTQGGPVLFTIGASDARPCPGLDAEDVPIAWSLDGRALFFARRGALTLEIHRLELSSSRQKLVWSLANQDPAGVRTQVPGWVRLTPDGKYYAFSFERVLSDLYLVEGLK